MSNRMFMRLVSLCVLCCFSGTLGAPFASAQTQSSATTTVVEGAKTGLSGMWFAWKDLIAKAAKPTMDQAAAIKFFESQGASSAQAKLLAANAAAEGHLTTALPKATEAAASASTATAQSSGNVFTRLFGKLTGGLNASPAAGESAAPASFLKASPVVQNGTTVRPSEAALTPADIKAGITTVQQKAALAVGGETVVAADAAKPGFLSRFTTGVKNTVSKVGATVKAGAQKVALATKRGASDATGVVRTGVLTAADKAAFWQKYYQIPVTDNLGIKVRGTLEYTTKFTNKGWVVDKYSSSTSMPGKGESADALFKIDSMAAAVEPAKMGFFAKIANTIKNGWTGVKNAVTGHKTLTPEAKAEISKIQVENQLLEKARTLNEVSSSIEQRISNLEQTAKALQRDVPADEIKSLRDTQRYVNEQKEVLKRKLSEVHDGRAVTVMKDAAKWALYSVGITAGVNIAKQVFSGEGIDLKAAFSFMGQPTFWGGTAGGFVGSMAGSYLGNMLLGSLTAGLPPGIGLFLRVVPGMLGAALGFEFGSSLLGGQMNLLPAVVQSIASAGGWTAASMIWTAAMGTAAPGIVLMAAAIGAGMLANFLMNKFMGSPVSEAGEEVTPLPVTQPTADPTTVKPSTTPAAPTGMSLAELQAKRSEAYQEYINNLKARKVAEARESRTKYEEYDKALQAAKAAESN